MFSWGRGGLTAPYRCAAHNPLSWGRGGPHNLFSWGRGGLTAPYRCAAHNPLSWGRDGPHELFGDSQNYLYRFGPQDLLTLGVKNLDTRNSC